MRLIKKISTIEVKRCFVAAQLIRWKKRYKGHIRSISLDEFKNKLDKANTKVRTFSEKQLDKIIAGEWQRRLQAYDSSKWYLAEVKPSELGVWKRAGELPLSWTNHSLKDTAHQVKKAILKGLKQKEIRAVHAIPGILKTNIGLIQSEKYLLPIVFKGGTGTEGRHGLKYKTIGDIDDGCMRSIALTISGARKIKVYFGFPKKGR